MVKIITDFRILMQYAYELGEAKKTGDLEKIAEAQKRHDIYRDICLDSDEMSIGLTVGGFSDVMKGIK